MKNCTEQEIARLQESLKLIRHSGGWSSEEFGDMIGVTKQTISNLENQKTVMSKIQYIAIRAVLDCEIAERKEDKLLSSTVNLCLNSDKVTKEDKKKAQAFISGAKKTGLDSTTIVAGIATLVGMTAIELLSTSTVIEATSVWLAKFLRGKE